MLSKSSGTLFLLCISIAFTSHLVYKYYRKKKKNEKREIHEVIIFSSGMGELKKSKYSRCMITESMDRLLYYLNTPQHTVDICMYVLTNIDITNAVLKLHFRGVKVRLIIDADMAFCSGSNVRRFEKQGIPVRWMKSCNLMHHKFVLIDTLSENDNTVPLLIMGSLNWTNQALCGNWEAVAVTSQTELVRQYREEFERLWILFKPVLL
ncbi:uncharacterized protein LOC131853455 [Achroia grisella]|uniref:uncharacterized protein LOC131853455 n=1 Tax=Achroia grisella TaxID=688607 RepID=UPI0027D2645B|nr:uncharacterized protein LOC131853455 [Achroia grisella]